MRSLIPLVCLAAILLGCSSTAAPAETPAPTAQYAPETPAPTEEYVPEVDCSQEEIQPIIESIAEQFGVSYDQVMAWACNGEALEDILLALQTSELTQRSPEELLKMKDEAGWDALWESLGLEAGQAP